MASAQCFLLLPGVNKCRLRGRIPKLVPKSENIFFHREKPSALFLVLWFHHEKTVLMKLQLLICSVIRQRGSAPALSTSFSPLLAFAFGYQQKWGNRRDTKIVRKHTSIQQIWANTAEPPRVFQQLSKRSKRNPSLKIKALISSV